MACAIADNGVSDMPSVVLLFYSTLQRTVDGFCDKTLPQSRDASSVATQSLMSTALVLAMLRQFDHPRYAEVLRLLEGSTSKVLEDPLQTGMLHQVRASTSTYSASCLISAHRSPSMGILLVLHCVTSEECICLSIGSPTTPGTNPGGYGGLNAAYCSTLLLIIKCCALVLRKQFQMVMEVEAPHMKLNIKPEVLKMAETRWRKQAQEITVSPLHMRVAVALRDLGMSILIEHTTEDNHFSMDIALVPKDWNQVLPCIPRPSLLLALLLELVCPVAPCNATSH